MRNQRNIIIFVLDALRSDHVNEQYMPFLSSLKADNLNVEHLISSSGFCERSEIFFGLKPSESSFVNAITLNGGFMPYSWLTNWLIKLLKLMESTDFSQRLTRRILWEISLRSRHIMHPQRIPLEILKSSSLTEDAINFESYAKKIKKGILYRAISKNYTINWRYFTSLSSKIDLSDSERLKDLKNKKHLLTKNFIPVYVGLPDELGHKYGVHHEKLIDGLSLIDKELESIYFALRDQNESNIICFMGDHGMENVKDGINVQDIVLKESQVHNLYPGIDFNYFIDSTMLRIWIINQEPRINDFLNSLSLNKRLIENGHFLTELISKKESLPPPSSIADMVWWAKKGVQVAPDFFHNSAQTKAGMHGYLGLDNPSHGFLIATGGDIRKKHIERLHLSDIEKVLDF